MVDRDGAALAEGPLDYRWPRVCINHPAYRQSRNELIDECARRFMTHPAVTTWDVHNEPNMGHNYQCYCDHTIRAYRSAVQSRFTTIDELNRATDQSFASFEAIAPPTSSAGHEKAWRHWRLFMSANLSEFLLEGRTIVKRHNSDALVTYNVAPLSPWRPQQTSIDWWTSSELDFLTKSHYAHSNEETASDGVDIAVLKELAGEKDVWITEAQGGPAPMGTSLFKPSWTGRDFELEMRLSTKRTIARLREHEAILDSGTNRNARVAISLQKHHLHIAGELGQPLDPGFGGHIHAASCVVEVGEDDVMNRSHEDLQLGIDAPGYQTTTAPVSGHSSRTHFAAPPRRRIFELARGDRFARRADESTDSGNRL
jgi:hypothetical protein